MPLFRLSYLFLMFSNEEMVNIRQLEALLSQNHPCIVAVDTGELPYWGNKSLPHSVIVVGLDADYIYVNDPDLKTGPIQIHISDFDLAWLNQDEAYAFVSK